MSTQTHTLHRALLRPFLLHTLRAAGFHSTKPSVLDTLVNLTERYLMLLASATAAHARNAHNDNLPSLSDVRSALQDCGALMPLAGAAEEEWKELLRKPIQVLGGESGRGGADAEEDEQSGNNNSNNNGRVARQSAEKRKREDEDVGDVRVFTRWFEGPQYAEICRVAGRAQEGDSTGAAGGGGGAIVGVGGGVVQVEDFLTGLKKRSAKSGAGAAMEDTRWTGTVLGQPADERSVLLEGGPVQRIADWRPPRQRASMNKVDEGVIEDNIMDDALSSSGISSPTSIRDEFDSPTLVGRKFGTPTLARDEVGGKV